MISSILIVNSMWHFFARAFAPTNKLRTLQRTPSSMWTNSKLPMFMRGSESLRGDARTNDNDYLYNLSLLGQGATFTSRNFGLATSAIATWAREMEREINRRKRFAEDLNSQYIGTIGERIVFTATVVYTNTYESDFGKTYFYKMKTDDGNVLGYFASQNMGWESGVKLTLKGTVKKQKGTQGRQATTVTRCSLFVPKEIEKAIKKTPPCRREGDSI